MSGKWLMLVIVLTLGALGLMVYDYTTDNTALADSAVYGLFIVMGFVVYIMRSMGNRHTPTIQRTYKGKYDDKKKTHR